jgi:hypothetical protein
MYLPQAAITLRGWDNAIDDGRRFNDDDNYTGPERRVSNCRARAAPLKFPSPATFMDGSLGSWELEGMHYKAADVSSLGIKGETK